LYRDLRRRSLGLCIAAVVLLLAGPEGHGAPDGEDRPKIKPVEQPGATASVETAGAAGPREAKPDAASELRKDEGDEDTLSAEPDAGTERTADACNETAGRVEFSGHDRSSDDGAWFRWQWTAPVSARPAVFGVTGNIPRFWDGAVPAGGGKADEAAGKLALPAWPGGPTAADFESPGSRAVPQAGTVEAASNLLPADAARVPLREALPAATSPEAWSGMNFPLSPAVAAIGSGLSPANAPATGLTLAAGTLQVNANDSLPDSGLIMIGPGAALYLNGYSDTFESLTNYGVFHTGTRPDAMLVGTGATITMAAGTFTVGSGITLSDAHIVITGGTNTVAAGGTLRLSSGGLGLELTGGTLTLEGAGTAGGVGVLSLLGNVTTYASPTTAALSDGGGTVYPGKIDLGGGLRTITTGWTGNEVDLDISASIANGSFIKDGSGALRLSGNNTYAGSTTVRTGELVVTHNNGLGTTASGTTVEVNGSLRLSNVTIGAESIFLEGGPLRTTGSNSLSGDIVLRSAAAIITGAGDFTIHGVIASEGGDYSLEKTGPGTLVLAGANTFTGFAQITEGTLILDHADGLGSTAGPTYISGGQLDLRGVHVGNEQITVDAGGFGTSAGTSSLAGIVELTAKALVTVGSNSELTLSGSIVDYGVLSGTDAIEKSGAGTLVLSGNNADLSGIVVINEGTVRLLSSSGLGSALGGTIVAAGGTLELQGQIGQPINLETEALTLNGGTLVSTFITNRVGGTILLGANSTVTATSALTLAGAITDGSNSFGFIKQGISALVLSGNNTYDGTTTLAAGVLELGSAGALGGGGNVTFTGGSLRYTTTNTQDIAARVKNSTAAIVVNTNGREVAYAGAIDATNTAGLTKNGTGTLTLSGANSYSGTTAVNAGTLRLGASGVLRDDGAVTVNGGTLDLNGQTETIGALTVSSGEFRTGQNGRLTGTGLTFAGGTSTISSGAIVSDQHLVITGGTNTVNAGGTLRLSTPVGGSSGLKLTGSTLTLNADSSLAGGRLVLQGEATTFASATTARIAAGGVGANLGTVDLDGGTRTFTVADGAAATDLAVGAVIANGGLIKAGAGVLELGGANTYTAGTTVNAGTLQLGAGGVLADSGAVSLAGGTVLNLNGFSETIGALTGNGSIQLGSGTLTLAGSVDSVFSGSISGAGNLAMSGTGTQTLSGISTYAGATSLLGGTLVAVGRDALGTGEIRFAGGTLRHAAADADYYLGRIANSSQAVRLDTAGQDMDLAVGLAATNTGGLTKVGAGTLTLTGATNHFGATTVEGGTLRLGADEVLRNDGAVVVSGGVLDLNGRTETIGTLTVNSGTFRTGQNARLMGTGSTITFAGGTNTIEEGSVVEDQHIVITGGTNTVEAGGTLKLSTPTGGPSGLELTGSTLTLNADATLAGGKLLLQGNVTTFASGTTAQIANSGAGANRGTIDLDGGTRTFTVADGAAATDLAIGAVIANGSLTKAGAGLLELTGANTYTGTTMIDAGTLLLGAANVIADTSAVVVASGAVLQSTFTETLVSLNGDGTLELGGGTLTLLGNSTFGTLHVTGNSVLNFSGTLAVTNFIVDAGVQFTVSNDFYAANWWTNASMTTLVSKDTMGTAPYNQVTITEYADITPAGTVWSSHDNHVTAVPEPSTYGALALGGVLGAVAWRRWWRQRKRCGT